MPPRAPPRPLVPPGRSAPTSQYRSVVRLEFTIAGSLESFNSRDFRNSLLRKFPDAEDVELLVRAASVIVDTRIIMPTSQAADAASNVLASASALDLSAELGASIEGVSAPSVTQMLVLPAPNPPPARDAFPPNAPADAEGGGEAVPILLGLLAAVALALGVYLYRKKKHQDAAIARAKARRIERMEEMRRIESQAPSTVPMAQPPAGGPLKGPMDKRAFSMAMSMSEPPSRAASLVPSLSLDSVADEEESKKFRFGKGSRRGSADRGNRHSSTDSRRGRHATFDSHSRGRSRSPHHSKRFGRGEILTPPSQRYGRSSRGWHSSSSPSRHQTGRRGRRSREDIEQDSKRDFSRERAGRQSPLMERGAARMTVDTPDGRMVCVSGGGRCVLCATKPDELDGAGGSTPSRAGRHRDMRPMRRSLKCS